MARQMTRTIIDNLTGSKSSSPKLTDAQLRDLIAKRAYEVFKKRGSRPGNALSDWVEAEKEIRREYNTK